MKSKTFSESISAACIIALCLLLCATKCAGQTPALDFSEYPKSIDGKTLSTWALFAGAGAMWGAREAYHAEATVFEKRWGVSPLSFWGSEAWKRNYWHNDPDAGHKPEYLGNVGRDVWHTFGFGSKAFIVTGCVAITGRKQPVKYRVVNLLTGLAIQSLTASLTYNLLRQ